MAYACLVMINTLSVTDEAEAGRHKMDRSRVGFVFYTGAILIGQINSDARDLDTMPIVVQYYCQHTVFTTETTHDIRRVGEVCCSMVLLYCHELRTDSTGTRLTLSRYLLQLKSPVLALVRILNTPSAPQDHALQLNSKQIRAKVSPQALD